MPEAHEGLPVAGYQPQSGSNVLLVNNNKVIEERVMRQLDYIEQNVHTIDRRWLAIARTQIEQGFMAMNRAVFKPGRVKLPEDRDFAEEKPRA